MHWKIKLLVTPRRNALMKPLPKPPLAPAPPLVLPEGCDEVLHLIGSTRLGDFLAFAREQADLSAPRSDIQDQRGRFATAFLLGASGRSYPIRRTSLSIPSNDTGRQQSEPCSIKVNISLDAEPHRRRTAPRPLAPATTDAHRGIVMALGTRVERSSSETHGRSRIQRSRPPSDA